MIYLLKEVDIYIYIYTLLEREERRIYAMSRNPRVCPAQNNVWCCAVVRSVTLYGSHGSYSSQCGNVGYQALATAKSRTAHRSQCDRCGNRPVPVSLALNIYVHVYRYTYITSLF